MKARESITIFLPPGTRAKLKNITDTTGLSKEAIFNLGIRYLALKAKHDEDQAAKQNTTILQKIKGVFKK